MEAAEAISCSSIGTSPKIMGWRVRRCICNLLYKIKGNGGCQRPSSNHTMVLEHGFCTCVQDGLFLIWLGATF